MFNLELQNYIDWDVKAVFKRNDRNKFAYEVYGRHEAYKDVFRISNKEGSRRCEKNYDEGACQWNICSE